MTTEHLSRHHFPRAKQHPTVRMVADREAQLMRTLRRAVSILSTADLPFAVGGDCAVYARGGPPAEHQVTIIASDEHLTGARAALAAGGMRSIASPRSGSRQHVDGDHRVTLLYPASTTGTAEGLLDRAETMRIGQIWAPVLSGTDLMIDKLRHLDSHRGDFVPMLPVARALCEQVDWPTVVGATADLPYARAFLGLLDDLAVTPTVEGRT
ncbi:hypothetical protein [Rhodococcus tibetensis]|uniref:Uncharacterized protein n=1 Tax=Rhodococcus tibetensis TaxID=2965064 RepID=A0ABT1QA71_9NOCA|nr:hypothetical protein [Rhodococcus sp. FXJ9.536]MCQ4118017.1 hypothetical protein [Rhodococcus sp. FXJ9.536]